MKPLKYISFIILLFFISFNVYAKDNTLTYNSTKEIPYQIDYLYHNKDHYFVISNNKIYSYLNNNLISEKEFTNLHNLQITIFQDQYLLLGLDNTTLKIYYLDEYLYISDSNELSITNLTNFKIYSYEDKIYLLDILNGILNSPNIYEIDNSLNIKENSFSSYSPEDLKNILQSDYYLIHQTDNNNYYNASTYTMNNNVLVGYQINNNISSSLITILDSNGEVLKQITNQDLTSFNDVTIINNKIITLTEDNLNTYLYIYDIEGNYLDKITISNSLHNHLYKINSSLYLINNNQINIYHYDYHIYSDNNLYGQINVLDTQIPYQEVTIDIKPNSGYQVSNIIVKDSKGNNIPLVNRTFTMPEEDVNIIVEYNTEIINPDTVDKITLFIFGFIALCILIHYIFHKYEWLK